MTRMKFANILLEKTPQFAQYPQMYYRSNLPIVFNEARHEWALSGKETFDFTTYFNALSVRKLKQYTTARFFTLHLELAGAACTITQTKATSFSEEAELVEKITRKVSEPDPQTWTALDIPLQIDDDAVLVGFQIETEGTVYLHNCYYSIETDQEPATPELALATTTFKKETFITHNVELIKNEILASDDEIAQHFHMHIIDNGRTLNAQEINCEGIIVHPNQNVGGAGGFTRGMLEAMDQTPEATHVLLMDDDVTISPESIKRTYNLLRVVNDEYKEALVSGAMFNHHVANLQMEDVGFIAYDGTQHPVKPGLNMAELFDCVYNEDFKLFEQDQMDQNYAGWWYCCIPLALIKKINLPIPVFVRLDDAEYGIRCIKANGNKTMSMNGICIWHLPFYERYNAAVERYQVPRNMLISQDMFDMTTQKTDFIARFKREFYLELKKFNYNDAELMLQSFEDYLKGPQYFSKKGVAEQTFVQANKDKEKFYSLFELKDILAQHDIDIDLSALTRQKIDLDEKRSLFDRMIDYLGVNHQRGIFAQEGHGFAIIPNAGWAYPAGKIRGKKYLIVIDWYLNRGALRCKDIKRYREIVKRYHKDMRTYKRTKKQLKQAYQDARPRLTSEEFWRDYLDMDSKNN